MATGACGPAERLRPVSWLLRVANVRGAVAPWGVLCGMHSPANLA